jgi:cyclopropane fatty-acyl-phospholipid synthase-like methyltransferase
VKFSKILKRTLLRALRPGRLFKAIRLQKRRKKTRKVWDDPQIKLYSEFLTNDMLHYGYFDDVNIPAEKISIEDIEVAQNRYTELFFEHMPESNHPVLDVGCGMGGLSNMLDQKGYRMDALTPDRHQVKYINNKYPNINVLHGKYEEYPEPVPMYGTIINAESFQYIRLDKIMDMTDKLLLPGGKWLVCDYFRIDKSLEKSGHEWDSFLEAIEKSSWTITYQRDITKNILPTLRYVNMFGERFIIPLGNYLLKKYEIKQPGLFFLTKDIVDEIPSKLDYWTEIVNPERYTLEKKYMFLVIERTADLKD